MIKIYCLVNPLTGLPFYVGSTQRTLAARLRSHLSSKYCESYVDTKSHARLKLIRDILASGHKPLIYCLIVVSVDLSNLFESGYYNYFSSQDIDLLQSQYRFTYMQHYHKK